MATNASAHANRFPAGPALAMRRAIVQMVDGAAEQSLKHLEVLRASWPSVSQASKWTLTTEQRVAYESFNDRLWETVKKIEKVFDEVFDEERISDFVSKLQLQTMVLALKGLRGALNKARRGLGDRIPPFRTNDWNRIHEGRVLANVQVIRGLGDWEKAQIARLIVSGASQGVPYREVAREIRETVATARVRAEAIAINELNRTYNMITSDRYQALGIKKAIWVTARDERVCPICLPLNGRTFEVGELVAEGKPPAHVRCRCTTIAHPDDVKSLRA